MHLRTKLDRNRSRPSRRLAAGLIMRPIVGLALLGVAPARAQMPGGGGMPAGKAAEADPFVASMSRWDANHDGTLTCTEWRQYANRMFTIADKNGDGFLDASEFRRIRQLEPIFADADMSYFDDNHNRRVSRAEFVDKPSPFIVRYDLNHDCRVTRDELNGTGGMPSGGRPRGGGGPGMGGERGGF